MAEYAFGADEYVVMKAQEVTPDGKKGLSSMRPSELILTNLNIVLPVKGLTGKVKSYEVYPLSDIRIVDGRPQCRLDKSDFMDVKLELSMNRGSCRSNSEVWKARRKSELGSMQSISC